MEIKKLLAGLAFAMFAWSTSASDPNQDFTLVNGTGLVIDQLYISSVKSSDWEEDVLGRDTLADGESLQIEFPVDEDHCRWDLMIVDSDEDKIVWKGLDLCSTKTITLYWENGTARASLD